MMSLTKTSNLPNLPMAAQAGLLPQLILPETLANILLFMPPTAIPYSSAIMMPPLLTKTSNLPNLPMAAQAGLLPQLILPETLANILLFMPPTAIPYSSAIMMPPLLTKTSNLPNLPMAAQDGLV